MRILAAAVALGGLLALSLHAAPAAAAMRAPLTVQSTSSTPDAGLEKVYWHRRWHHRYYRHHGY